MSRNLCKSCSRPEKACICQFITPLDNSVHVVILQHPSEVKQTKGTVSLLSKSLKNCQTIVGEEFCHNESLLTVLANYHCFLLYPQEQAQTLTKQSFTSQNISEKPLCMIILEGTWKKAYRMFQLNTVLQNLPRFQLPQELASSGKYLIRSVAKENALSSLEACCFALALIEQNNCTINVPSKVIDLGQYQTLLNKFDQFNQFQLSFVPKSHQP